jgi:hypothetical protein
MDSDHYASGDRDDVKLRSPMVSGHLLARVASAPEPRPADGPFPPSFEQKLRKRDSPMDRPYPRLGDMTSPSAKHYWPSRSSSPRGDMEEPPDKRPRLEYLPKKVEAERDASKRRTEPYVRFSEIQNHAGNT